jgi:predicted metal-dependent HD superfamily phosphohydrolase
MFDIIGETPVTKKVEDIILETKNISPSNYFDFWKFDNSILLDSDFDKLLDYETKIRNEFSVYNDEEYKKGRIEFLNNFLMNNTIDSKQANLINNLKSYINSVYR